MTGENRMANAALELAAAYDALRVAEAALGIGILRDAISRAYYAAFHAARALVLWQGFEARTHGGLSRLFNEHLVRSGLLEPRYNLVLARLQAYRQASDYAYAFEIGPDEARAEVAAARDFVDRASSLTKSS